MKKETNVNAKIEGENVIKKVAGGTEKIAANLKKKQDRELRQAHAKKRAIKAVKPELPNELKSTKAKGKFLMKLKLADKEYTSSSDDLKEAILGLKPDKISAKAFFTLEYDGKSATLVSIIPRTKRIIGNEMTAYFFGRRIMQLLK